MDYGLGFWVASVGFSALPRPNASIALACIPPTPTPTPSTPCTGGRGGHRNSTPPSDSDLRPHTPTAAQERKSPQYTPRGGGGGTEAALGGGIEAIPPPGRTLAWLPYTPAASFAPKVEGGACKQQGTGGCSVGPTVGNLIESLCQGNSKMLHGTVWANSQGWWRSGSGDKSHVL